MTSGKARHLSRRSGVRKGIPDCVPLPKFISPAEIRTVLLIKERNPNRSWEDIIAEVISLTMVHRNGINLS